MNYLSLTYIDCILKNYCLKIKENFIVDDILYDEYLRSWYRLELIFSKRLMNEVKKLLKNANFVIQYDEIENIKYLVNIIDIDYYW